MIALLFSAQLVVTLTCKLIISLDFLIYTNSIKFHVCVDAHWEKEDAGTVWGLSDPFFLYIMYHRSHVAHMDESWPKHEWIMSHENWVFSYKWLSQVTHTNACNARRRISSECCTTILLFREKVLSHKWIKSNVASRCKSEIVSKTLALWLVVHKDEARSATI